MGYIAQPLPAQAGPQYDSALRNKAMSRRPRQSVPRPLAALNKINPGCDCKVSMITSCIIDKQPGCDERRKNHSCACTPRWLPTCILDPKTPHGCKDWRIGTRCQCSRAQIPRCLIAGCEERQKGKRCDERHCTRTPAEICPHLKAEFERYKALSSDDAAAIIGQIVHDLEVVNPKVYREPRQPSGPGVIARVGEAAVCLMARRKHHNLSLYNPGDVRYIDDEQIRRNQERRQLQGLIKLAKAVAAGRAS